jgi:hypothetical protein
MTDTIKDDSYYAHGMMSEEEWENKRKEEEKKDKFFEAFDEIDQEDEIERLTKLKTQDLRLEIIDREQYPDNEPDILQALKEEDERRNNEN